VRQYTRSLREQLRLGNVLAPVSGEIDTEKKKSRAKGTPAEGIPASKVELDRTP